MAKTLEAHDRLLKEVFSDQYQFFIPEYQRPYAWTTEQAEELFDDLISAMRSKSDDGTQYFMGSIVLIKPEKESKSVVVDGQQRLTTLTILLSALRERLPKLAVTISKLLYREADEILGVSNAYRLTAREEDEVFFRAHIQEPGGLAMLTESKSTLIDSRLRLRENATLFLQRLNDLSPDECTSLLVFLVNDCSLVVISTPDLDAAYRIFSVLNNRGLDLEAIDILKAAILGEIRKDAGEAKSREYAKVWSSLEMELGRGDFGDMFAHIRTIYSKRKPKATLVREFQEYVTEYTQPIKLVDNVLCPFSEVWSFIQREDYSAVEMAEQVNERLYWLNQVEFKDWVPPAMLFCRTYRHAPTRLVEFLAALERLTYYLLVTRTGINERIDVYAHLTAQIEAKGFVGLIQHLPALNLTLRQQSDFAKALDGDIYRRLPRARMPILLRLEALKSDGGKKMEFKDVTIEHVLPQTPPKDSEWMAWFPEETQREEWTHRLANLVPLHFKKNPAASNFPFQTKKDVYFVKNGTSSPFILTNEVRAVKEWTPDVLEKRQADLVKRLCAHWNLNDAEYSVVAARAL